MLEPVLAVRRVLGAIANLDPPKVPDEKVGIYLLHYAEMSSEDKAFLAQLSDDDNFLACCSIFQDSDGDNAFQNEGVVTKIPPGANEFIQMVYDHYYGE